MTADAKTCPSCGRRVPDDHTLCIKCGARLDDPAALTGPVTRLSARSSQRLIAFWVALAAIAGLVGLIWWLTAGSPERPPRRPTPPPRATAQTPAPRPTPDPRPAPRTRARPPGVPRPPGAKPRSPSTFPLHPAPSPSRADAGVAARPTPRLTPPPKSARPGVLAGLRRCVDASRKRAEADCADIRRYLGHTAESACLWSKIVKRYWTCIKKKTKRITGCVAGCATRGAACVTGCVAQSERKAGETTGTCLLRCWRKRIDPCLGKCTRP